MSDLISRQNVLNKLEAFINLSEYYHPDEKCESIPVEEVRSYLEKAPALVPGIGIIRCQDCKWWEQLDDDHPYGNCKACRSTTFTSRWNISIQRQCKFDFFCADAEPIEEEEDDDDDA